MPMPPRKLLLKKSPQSAENFQRRHARNYFLMARQLVEEGNLKEARPLLERALEFDPNLSPALLTMAGLEVSAENFQIAREYVRRAIALDQHNAAAYAMLGNIELTEHNPSAALEAYLRAGSFSEATPELRFYTGLAYLFLGEAKKAEELLTFIIDEDPTHQRAWDALGSARRLLKDYPGAINAFIKSLELDPDSCDSRDHLAQVMLDTGNPQQALKILESVHIVEPQRETTRHLLGMACAALLDYKRASAYWSELISQGAASSETYQLLANAYLKLGDRAHARETLRSLVNSYPDYVPGLLQSALMLIEDGEPEKGLHYLEEARERDPQNPMLATIMLTAEAFKLNCEHVDQ